MNDFKKNYKPGGARQGSFSRPSFGKGSGPRRDFDRGFNGPSESFRATCSKCHKPCEVPFRPNGKKPVFCKDCFVRDDSRDARPSYGNSYEKRTFDRPERAHAPVAAEDPRIGALQRELAVIHEKLDTLIQSLESAAYSSILTASAKKETKPASAAKPVKKAAVKTAPKKATKKAPKKK